MTRIPRYDPELARLAERRRVAEVQGLNKSGAGTGRRRAQAGRWWEDRLELVHRTYEARNQAVIAYAAARTTPIRRDGRIVAVKMERGKVDYLGRVAGRPIAFDCKGCIAASWRLKTDEAHQLDFLRAFARDPRAIAFFLLADSAREELLIVPQQCVQVSVRVRLRVRGVPQFPVVPRATGALEFDYLPTVLDLFSRVIADSPQMIPGNAEVTPR